MRNIIRLLVFAGILNSVYAQKKDLNKINMSVNKTEIEAHLSFLAADEMRGRNTGSPEIDIAANYVTAQFKIFGVKPVAGQASYFQDVNGLEKISQPSHAEFSIDTTVFHLKDDLVILRGVSTDLNKEVIFIGYGTKEDFQNNPVKDKIVIAYAGTSTTQSPIGALMHDSPAKRRLAIEAGAAALVEIMALPGVPWPAIAGYLGSERVATGADVQPVPFCHVILRNSEAPGLLALRDKKVAHGKLAVKVTPPQSIRARNVVGIIEGTDPKLKDEWIAVSAHYDHIGVKHNNSTDSIFNGARDNAIGTVALLEIAKFFSLNKPKRSVLLIALTAEEIGLVGSKWYAEHPLIPLNKTVFDLNCDGAGYNDKTIATVIDVNRTTADESMKKACLAFGLTLQGDPDRTQNLFERSDNYNFAQKGVPAVNFSPGVKAFDQELFKYYHQPADETGSLDFDYLEKFYKAFVYATHLISNAVEKPTWVKGDKFEEAGKTLYSK